MGSTAQLCFFFFASSQTVFICHVGRQHGFDEPVCPGSWKRFPPPALLPPRHSPGTAAGRCGTAGRDAPRSRWPGKLGPRIRRRAGSRQGRGRAGAAPAREQPQVPGPLPSPCRRPLPGASRLFLQNSSNNNNNNNNDNNNEVSSACFSEERLKT